MNFFNEHIHLRFWLLATIVSGCVLAGVFSSVNLAHKANRLGEQIQQQRRTSIIHSCQVQNAAQVRTLKQLRKNEIVQLVQVPKTTVREFQDAGIKIDDPAGIEGDVRKSVRSRFGLQALTIKATLPHRNCTKLAAQKVR